MEKLKGEMRVGNRKTNPCLNLQNFGFYVCKKMGREQKTPVQCIQCPIGHRFCKSNQDFRLRGRRGTRKLLEAFMA